MFTRHTGKFLIVSSSTGYVIGEATTLRHATDKKFRVFTSVGDPVAINAQIIELAKLKGDNTVTLPWVGQKSKLYIPGDIPPTSFNQDGELLVSCVEIATNDKKKTQEMCQVLWEKITSPVEIFQDTLKVSGSDASSVISMVIGRGGSNIRHLTKDRKGKTMGKIFTRREDDPTCFIIEGNSQKAVNALKTSLRHEIQRKTEIIRVQNLRKRQPDTTSNTTHGFATLAYDSDSEDEEDFNFGAPGMAAIPTITLAQRLEDGLARGETFDETLPTKKKDTFMELAKKCSNIDEWGISDDEENEF
tara:strand:- start:283 stop:1191 length:909 start_codon:yes stop_codon:yes gene_type:complete